ncbi:MAG: hypothetical protein DMF67_02625 [Acidobacteria bacterium]|nr:MAG: hypothetical protein DMF67_02625 [Acidobacteriota bacterium]
MNLVIVLIIGIITGALPGLSTFAVERHPNRTELLLAAIMRGVLVSLLTALSLKARSPWWHGLGLGALYGLLTALTVALAMGGLKSPDTIYIVPFAPVMGAVAGVLIQKLAFRRSRNTS